MTNMVASVSSEYVGNCDRIIITYYVEDDELKYEGPAFYSKKHEIQLKQIIRSGLVQKELDKTQPKRQRKGSHPKGKRSAEDLSELILNKPSPTVETMKELLPDMMDAVFYSDEARLKIAGKWQTRPQGWPDDVRLVPPGNYINEGGQKRKTRLADLKPMYDFLRHTLLKMQNKECTEDKHVIRQADGSEKSPIFKPTVTEQKTVDKTLLLHMRTSTDYDIIKKRKIEHLPVHGMTHREISDTSSEISFPKSVMSPPNESSREPSAYLPATLNVFDEQNVKFVSSPTILVKSEDVKKTDDKMKTQTTDTDPITQHFLYKNHSEVRTTVSPQTMQYSRDSDVWRGKRCTLNGASLKSNGFVKKDLHQQRTLTLSGESVAAVTPTTSAEAKYNFQTLKNGALDNTRLSCNLNISSENIDATDVRDNLERSSENTEFVPTPVQMLSCSPSHNQTRAGTPEFHVNKEKTKISSPVYPMFVPSAADAHPGVHEENAKNQNTIQNTGMPLPHNGLSEETQHSPNRMFISTHSADKHASETPTHHQIHNLDNDPKFASDTSATEISQQAEQTKIHDLKDMPQPCINITVPAKITLLPEQSQPGMLTGSAMINMPLNMAILQGITSSRPIMTAQPSPVLAKTVPSSSPLTMSETVKSTVFTPVITPNIESLGMAQKMKMHPHIPLSTVSISSPKEMRTPTHIETETVNHADDNITDNKEASRPTETIISANDSDSAPAVNVTVSAEAKAHSDGDIKTIPSSFTIQKTPIPDESDADLLLFFSKGCRDDRLQENTEDLTTNPVTTETKQLDEEEIWRSMWNRKRGGGGGVGGVIGGASSSSLQHQTTVASAHATVTVPSSSGSHHLPSGLTQAAALSVRPPNSKVNAKRSSVPLAR